MPAPFSCYADAHHAAGSVALALAMFLTSRGLVVHDLGPTTMRVMRAGQGKYNGLSPNVRVEVCPDRHDHYGYGGRRGPLRVILGDYGEKKGYPAGKNEAPRFLGFDLTKLADAIEARLTAEEQRRAANAARTEREAADDQQRARHEEVARVTRGMFAEKFPAGVHLTATRHGVHVHVDALDPDALVRVLSALAGVPGLRHVGCADAHRDTIPAPAPTPVINAEGKYELPEPPAGGSASCCSAQASASPETLAWDALDRPDVDAMTVLLAAT